MFLKKHSLFISLITILVFLVLTLPVVAEEGEENLEFGNKVLGEITADNENDRYIITLDEPGLLKVDFSSYINNDVNIQLKDSNGSNVINKEVSDGLPTSPEKLIYSEYLEAGTYYLTINRVINYWVDNTGKYELTVNFEETNNNESEPNNGTSQADEITFNQNIVGLISWNDSNDTYKVIIPEPGLLKLDFSSYIYNEVNVQLNDSNGSNVFTKNVTDGQSTNPKKLIYSEYLEAGTYYLTVNRVINHWVSHTGKYDFLLDFKETNNNEPEPNNGTAEAAKVSFNENIEGLISWNDPIDSYKVIIKEAGLLKVDFSSYIYNEVNIQLNDANGSSLFYKDVIDGQSTNPMNFKYSEYVEAGTYYLTVNRVINHWVSHTGSYDLLFDFEEANTTEIEPNNGTVQAQRINLDEKVTGLLSWNDEIDTYELNMQEAGDITLNFSSYISQRVSLRILDQTGNEIVWKGLYSGTPTSPENWEFSKRLESGKYYIQISKINGDEGKYELTVKSKSGWVQENGKWFYYLYGSKQTGWLKSGSHWYYLGENGEMKTGWLKSGTKWYYLESSGAMKTGWLKSGTKWYYLESSGAMKTGWLKSGTKWYYLESSGAMKTGWLLSGGKWYYLYTSGAMAYNTVLNGYKLGSDGAWIR